MLVTPDRARQKLEALAAVGIGHRRAACLTGLARSTIERIRHGDQAHIQARVEQAILNVQRPSLAHGVRVNSYQTRHLLACLLTEGFSKPWIAARLGLHRCQLWRHAEAVTVTKALKVRALYTEVSADL